MKDKHSRHSKYVISIMSKDRVGIVADATRVVSALDGNLADLSQTVLCGFFTMILIADFPEAIDAARLKRELEALPPSDGETIVASVKLVKDTLPSELSARQGKAGDEYVLTAVGKDRSGLVAKISALLAREKINILDLSTTVNRGQYTMIFLVDVPTEERLAPLREKLLALGESEKLGIALQHNDIFKATNEI